MERRCMTPGIFWYWNATPSPGGIRRQLAAMRDAGFRCVYLHPMPDSYHKDFFFQGMEASYLGKRFFELARIMLDECRRLGLTMMLYDEGGWPSGSVVDTLVKKYPEDRVRALVRDNGSFREIRLEIPDLTNPAVTGHFIEMVYERYREELGQAFGGEIQGIFTDEPFWECHLSGEYVAVPEGIDDELAKRYGIVLEDILPLLFSGNPRTREVGLARRRYVDACTMLFARNYSEKIARWCHENRLQFEGHFLFEERFFQCGFFNDFPRVLDPMDVPGVDAIFRQIYPGGGRGQYARFAQCSAIRNRRAEALAECFNVYGYAMTSPVMYYVANLLAVKGINRILTMPYLYSDRGMRKIGCSSDYSPRNPLWRHLRPLNDYLAWLGQYDAGALDPEVRVLAVTECFAGDGILHPLPAAKEYADAVDAMLERLDDALVFWRFTTPDELAEGTPPEILILPGECHIPEVNARLEELNARGVRIIDGFAVSGFEEFSRLPGAEKIRDVRILPCLRPEGRSLLVFNASDGEKTLRFRSEEGWRELFGPDPTASRLAPFEYRNGVYELPLPPWNLRILGEGAPPPPDRRPEPVRRLKLNWRIIRVERLRYSKLAPTKYETLTETRPLPPDGMYSNLEPDFSGTIRLAAEFESPEAFEGFLRFDRICYGGALRMNRRDAGMRAFPPWVYPVRVRKGQNHLELTVNSSAGNEWKRCFREELEPAGWFNDYIREIEMFQNDSAECGAAPEATLYPDVIQSCNQRIIDQV